jgi:hypothetical protein
MKFVKREEMSSQAQALDETLAEIRTTFAQAKQRGLEQHQQAHNALDLLNQQLQYLQQAKQDPIGFLMGRHFPEGSELRKATEEALAGVSEV